MCLSNKLENIMLKKRFSDPYSHISLSFLLIICLFMSYISAAIVDIEVIGTSSSDQNEVYFTFGQVFHRGDVPAGSWLVGSDNITLQVDAKATHTDGSLRHAIITGKISNLPENTSRVVSIMTSSTTSDTTRIPLSDLLSTDFNAIVSLNVDGIVYELSARDLLENGPVEYWLVGPQVTEWIVSSPFKRSDNIPHSHLSGRFNIRAYAGFNRVRVSVVVENCWSQVPNPQNYAYNVTVSIPGKGIVLSENDLTHYRQARWRRVFWWGEEPLIHIKHDARYLMRTGAIPTYDSTVTIPNYALSSMEREWQNVDGLMQPGLTDTYMPGPGGRPDIAPLPGWAVCYLISQDIRAKTSTLGTSEQAGSWSIHYRDEYTNLPISLDTYPNMTIIGDPFWFPGGEPNSPYEPDMSHQPSLSYVPYLITGDYFHLEELQFWANWNMFYGPASRHGYAQGLISWDQIRGQAWGLRTVAHAAYITPDAHPLKAYFLEKLNNNIDYYNKNWLNWNPLGYITNQSWLDLDKWISTWMDDFLTWTFGHLVSLGFTNAADFRDYKAKFPVGRMTHPDYCWILASTSWPYILDDRYLGGPGNPVDTWDEYRRNVIWSWNNDSFRPLPELNIDGREQQLVDAPCNSSEMFSIMNNWPPGKMIGYDGPDGYPANMQPALAVALEANLKNADLAWSIFLDQNDYPNFNEGDPQWAVIPGQVDIPTAVNKMENGMAESFSLAQNYPNPFNSSTTIKYRIAHHSYVELRIYDILGQNVFTLMEGLMDPGEYHIFWDGKNANGEDLPSGIYIYMIRTGSTRLQRKLLLMK